MRRLVLCVLLVPGLCSQADAQQASAQLGGVVQTIPGLETSERARLKSALDSTFAGLGALPAGMLRAVQGVINAGLFELTVNTGDEDGPMADEDLVRVSQVARVTYDAIARGANPDLVEDLALVAFGREVTSLQIEAAAKALDRFMATQMDANIYQEVIAQAMDNGWAAEVTRKVSDGLIRGVNEGLDAESLALTLIIGVAQNPSLEAIDRVVEDAIVFVRTRRNAAYEALRQALRAGLAPPVGREIYYMAIEEGWPTETLEAVLDGLVRGQKMGLTPEKLATALILRVAQGLGTTPLAQVVQEEIDYVRELDRERLQQIQSDLYLQQAYQTGKQWEQLVYVPPRREETLRPDSLKTGLRRCARALMEASVKDFLGTPYKWGGTAKKRGVDCSGFTQGVYRDQGISIPRVSRDQYKRAPVKIEERNGLRYGDLVFFNKNGGVDRYITHVGLYLGSDEKGIGRFIHASSSKGVTISRFNKRYYKSRYVGGGRVAKLQE